MPLTVEPGIEYAIEITETKIIRSERSDKIEEKTLIRSREKFAKELEKEAKELKILSGSYCIFYLLPWTFPLREIKKKIKKDLLVFIKDTKNDFQTDPLDIKINYMMICTIIKINSEPDIIVTSYGDGAWPDSDENQKKVSELIQYAVDNKMKRLSKEEVLIPRILLILNSYQFAYDDVIKKCLPHLNNLEYFHSIFIVKSSSGFFLHTKETAWKDKG